MPQDALVEELRATFDFDPLTGHFAWARRVGNSRVAIGARAGSRAGNGYTQIPFDGKNRLAHRLAWLYVYGKWPVDEIDHINGDRADNRIANLRDVKHLINMQNLRARGTYMRPNGRWTAQKCIRGVRQHLGLFATEADAFAAYKAAAPAV